MADWVKLLSLPLSAIALIVSIISRVLGRRELVAQKREKGHAHFADAEQDLNSVNERVPVLRTYWQGSFELRGVLRSSMWDTKSKGDDRAARPIRQHKV